MTRQFTVYICFNEIDQVYFNIDRTDDENLVDWTIEEKIPRQALREKKPGRDSFESGESF